MPITNPRIRELAERAWREANKDPVTAARLLQARTGLGLIEAFEIIEETRPANVLRHRKCSRCGERDAGAFGLCRQCNDEFDDAMARDD